MTMSTALRLAQYEYPTSLPAGHLSKSILLADAHEPRRKILKAMLEREGHHVSACRDLPEAISRFQEAKFDFVITEHSRDGINGIRMLESIKERRHTVPVLMISSIYEWEPYLIAMNLGALDYLNEPLNYDSIQRLIKYAR
jgi:DNA-binding NtrC family response regulator